MTLVRQVRELKIEREDTIKRENTLNAKVDKLQDSESILRKQMDHALSHVSSLRKQLSESELKMQQLDEKMNGDISINSDEMDNKASVLERKNQSLIHELDKLKYQVTCLKSKSVGSNKKDLNNSNSNSLINQDSLSRTTGMLSFGSGNMFNMF